MVGTLNKGYMVINTKGEILYNGVNIIKAISCCWITPGNSLYPANNVFDAAIKSIIAIQSRLN